MKSRFAAIITMLVLSIAACSHLGGGPRETPGDPSLWPAMRR